MTLYGRGRCTMKRHQMQPTEHSIDPPPLPLSTRAPPFVVPTNGVGGSINGSQTSTKRRRKRRRRQKTRWVLRVTIKSKWLRSVLGMEPLSA